MKKMNVSNSIIILMVVLIAPLLFNSCQSEISWEDLDPTSIHFWEVDEDETVNVWALYRNRPFTGTVNFSNDDNEALLKVQYKDGRLHGSFLIYDENGQILSKLSFKNGLLHGEAIEYNDEGQPATLETYKDGELFGKSKKYTDEGQLIEQREYKKGKLNGESLIYFESGKVKEKKNYQDNILHGKWEGYYENGNIKEKKNYQNGELHGKWEGYYESGELKARVMYEDGLLMGERESFHRDGRLMQGKVVIGDQIWMTKNLNVDKFRNGDPIPEAKINEEWATAGRNGQPAWCYYNNDPANGKKYGKLYNWYAVNDPRGLAPKGWKIPSDEDWTVLTDYLGDLAGTKMKSTNGWVKSRNGTNESGFSALPGGTRVYYFAYFGKYGGWWSSTENTTNDAWYRDLYYFSRNVDSSNGNKGKGLSVRCLRD